jgi:hypothetical protein
MLVIMKQEEICVGRRVYRWFVDRVTGSEVVGECSIADTESIQVCSVAERETMSAATMMRGIFDIY